MKKLRNAALLFLVVSAVSSQASGILKSPFTISGHIRGLKDDSICVYARIQDAKGNIVRIDTFSTVANNERFTIKGFIEDPSYAQAKIGKDRSAYFSFIIEKGNIIVEGDMASVQDAVATGTPDNDVVKEFASAESSKYRQIRALYKSYNKEDKAAAQKAEHQADSIQSSIFSNRMDFIRSHPNAMYSGIYIYVLQDRVSLDKLESLYNGLSDRIKKNSFGKSAGEKIIARKRTVIGNNAPAFTMNDADGRPLSLSSLKGKYVLLEFWASWCVPCRQEIPSIKTAYERFKNKDFVIVGISVDSDRAKWLKALEEENLPWANLSDITGFDNSVAKLYGVQPIPDNFLIDKEGKIIARGLRGTELETKLATIFN